MATPTYDLLDSRTIATSTATVSFIGLGSISSDYRDLIIVGTVIQDSTSRNAALVYFNSDTGANYSRVQMYAFSLDDSINSADLSDTATSIIFCLGGTIPHYGQIQIFDFNQTDKHKTVITRFGAEGASELDVTNTSAQRWASTDAITTIDLTLATNTFEPDSRIDLYGIKA